MVFKNWFKKKNKNNKKVDLYRVVYTYTPRKKGEKKRLNVEAFVTSDKRGGAWVLGGRKHLHDVCFLFCFIFEWKKLFALATTRRKREKKTVSLLYYYIIIYRSSISLTGGGFLPPTSFLYNRSHFQSVAQVDMLCSRRLTLLVPSTLFEKELTHLHIHTHTNCRGRQGQQGEMTTVDWRTRHWNKKNTINKNVEKKGAYYPFLKFPSHRGSV
jgi:hypothetical protein